MIFLCTVYKHKACSPIGRYPSDVMRHNTAPPTVLHFHDNFHEHRNKNSLTSSETGRFHPSRKSELLQNVLFFGLLQVPVLHHWFCTVSKISLVAYSFTDLHLRCLQSFKFHSFGESVFHYDYTEVRELILKPL